MFVGLVSLFWSRTFTIPKKMFLFASVKGFQWNTHFAQYLKNLCNQTMKFGQVVAYNIGNISIMFSHFFTWCIKGLNCQVNSWNVQNSVSVPRRNFLDFLFCKLKPNPNSFSNFEGVKNQISTLNWQFLSQIQNFCLKIS